MYAQSLLEVCGWTASLGSLSLVHPIRETKNGEPHDVMLVRLE